MFIKRWLALLLIIVAQISWADDFCDSSECRYHVPLGRSGAYIAVVTLPNGQADGMWSLTINPGQFSPQYLNGFWAGSILKERGELPSWIAFSLSRTTPINVTPYDWISDGSPLTVQIDKDMGGGQRMLVYGPTLMTQDQTYTTPPFNPGFYITSFLSQPDSIRTYRGLALEGHGLFGGVVGGYLDSFSGVGYSAFIIRSPQTIEFLLSYGDNFANLGASQPYLEIYYQHEDGTRELSWSGSAPSSGSTEDSTDTEGTTGEDNSDNTITQLITTEEGGNLVFPDGTELVIPPNVLIADTTVSITREPSNSAFELEPEGLITSSDMTLKIPVTLEMISDPSKVISAFIYSDESPVNESEFEQVRAEKLLSTLASDYKAGDMLELKFNHFSTIIKAIQDSLYLPLTIYNPDKFLKKGDIQFVLSDLNVSGLKSFDWLPGHVGIFTGTGSVQAEHCKTPEGTCDLIHSTFSRNEKQFSGVQGSNLESIAETDSAITMGIRRPKDFFLTATERDQIVNWTIEQLGKGYIVVKNFNPENNTSFSCVGLVEEAYKTIGKPIVGKRKFFSSLDILYPYDMYEKTVPVTEITAPVGETIKVHVNPVFTQKVLKDGREFEEYFDYRNLKEDASRSDQIKLTASNLPQGATFDFEDKGYFFNWTVPESYVGTSTTVTFELTSEYHSSSKTENFTIVVQNLPPTAHIDSITGSDGTSIYYTMDVITFKGSGTDPEGQPITKYTWSFGDGSRQQEGQTVTNIYTKPGTYQVELWVMDSEGGVSAEDGMIKEIVVVEPPVDNPPPVNQPPKLSVNAPSTVRVNQRFPISYDYSDPDGNQDVIAYHISMSDGTTGTFTTEQIQGATYGFGTTRSHWIEVYVTDTAGNASNHVRINIEVIPTTVENGSPSVLGLNLPSTVAVNETFPIKYDYFDPDGVSDVRNHYIFMSDGFETVKPVPNPQSATGHAQFPGAYFATPGTHWIQVYIEDSDRNNSGPVRKNIEVVSVAVDTEENVGQAQCETVIKSGGNTPDTYIVELEETSGTFTLEYNTLEVKDQILVSYEGITLRDTLCVGTEGNEIETISYNGSSTQVMVQVVPNCEGEEDGTRWNYTIHCPY